MLLGKSKQSITNRTKKAEYNLDQQISQIFALSSGNVGKYEFSTGTDGLQAKRLLEKARTYKDLSIHHSPLL